MHVMFKLKFGWRRPLAARCCGSDLNGIRSEAGGAAAVLVLVALVFATLGGLVPAVVVVASALDCGTPAVASELAADEIPVHYLAMYRQAGEAAGVDWSVLAAIGWIETRHGSLDAEGVRSGMNLAGAAGPMQFGIGGKAGNTWGGAPVRRVPPMLGYGVDGDGDGIADVYNPADAIAAAGGYLVAHGADEDLRGALYAYNHAGWYVDKVLDKASQYSGGTFSVAGSAYHGDPQCLGVGGASADAGGAWGGYENGRIPLNVLCPIGSGHLLRCDAAASFVSMDQAHRRDLGRPIPVSDSYRDYAGQVAVHASKPHLAATPGRSNHGWAVALDIAVGGWTGETFLWLQRNAGQYGWHHPTWAQINGSKPEEWHWEYRT